MLSAGPLNPSSDINFIQKQINTVKNEQKWFNLIDFFIKKHGRECFLKNYSEWKIIYYDNENHETAIKSQATILFAAIMNNYYQLVEKLLALKVDVNLGTECSSANEISNSSPLMGAIEEDNLKMVKLLIKYQANLLHVDSAGSSILMRLGYSKKILNYILTAAEEQKCKIALIKIINKSNKDIGYFYLDNKEFELLKIILKNGDINASYLKLFLDDVRRQSFEADNQDDFYEHDELCTFIKNLPNYKFVFQRDTSVSRFADQSYASCYEELFGRDPGEPQDEEAALKRAVADVFYYFKNPMECLEILTLLNSEFKRYYEETYPEPLPKLDKTLISYVLIAGVLYPIPKKLPYVGLGKKHNALEKFLIEILREHDLAEESLQWIGYIPNDIADEMVKKGYFLKETLYGIGILHGRNAHMFQLVLMASLYKAKLIRHDYYDKNGILHTLSLKEINAALVQIKDKNNKGIWIPIRDNRYFNFITISDPHLFSSFLMLDKSYYTWFPAEQYGWDRLTDYLIDSFCKNYSTLLIAIKEITKQNDNDKFDTIFFASCLKDLQTHLFGEKLLAEYAIQKAKNIHCQGYVNNYPYAVIVKKYHRDNLQFTIKPYHDNLYNAILNVRNDAMVRILKTETIDPNKFVFSKYLYNSDAVLTEHTPLTLAVRKGNEIAIIELLKHPNINVNVQDIHGKTPLYYALDGNRPTIIDCLMAESTIDPAIGCFENGAMPLNIAIQLYPSQFKKLLEKTRDRYLNKGFDALSDVLLRYLSRDKKELLMSILTKNGTIPLSDKIKNFTLLQHAIACGRVRIVQELLNRGVSMAVNENGIDVIALAKVYDEEGNNILNILQEYAAKQTLQFSRSFHFFSIKENNVHASNPLIPLSFKTI